MINKLKNAFVFMGHQIVRPIFWVVENPTIKLLLLLSLVLTAFAAIGVGLAALMSSTAVFWVCFAIGAAINIATYWFSDKIVVALTGAKSIDDNPDYKDIKDMLIELTNEANAKDSKLKMIVPKLYFMNDRANAFATGRNPQNGLVCVTSDLLNIFDRNNPKDRAALKAILAHEISHIRHRDILFMTTATLIMSFLETASTVAYYNARDSFLHPNHRTKDDDTLARLGILVTTFMLSTIIVPITKTLSLLFLSRTREYGADKGAFELMGQAQPMIDGLDRLRRYVNNEHLPVKSFQSFNPRDTNIKYQGIRAMCLSPETEAPKQEKKPKQNTFFRFISWLVTEGLSTHPRFENRISSLEKLQKEQDEKLAKTSKTAEHAHHKQFAQDSQPEPTNKTRGFFGFGWSGDTKQTMQAKATNDENYDYSPPKFA